MTEFGDSSIWCRTIFKEETPNQEIVDIDDIWWQLSTSVLQHVLQEYVRGELQ